VTAAVVLVEAPPTAHERLATLEAVVERDVGAFIRVGRALATIRDERLFLATHATFKDYLENRWGFGQQWAYGQVYASQVADAISTFGGSLPAGIAADALRPLVPLLNREGPEAVARAWAPVDARCSGRQRPPSRSEVRAALVEHGIVTVAPEKPRGPQLGPIGSGLLAAAERVQRLRDRLGDRLLPPPARARAAEFALIARRLADDLEALADSSAASARLAAVEPLPEGELCVGHGLRRLEDGLCAACRRPDLTAYGRVGGEPGVRLALISGSGWMLPGMEINGKEGA
jgi:hypothetical protein